MSAEKEKEITASIGTMSENVKSFFQSITVEPMKLLHKVPLNFAKIAIQNLNMEKACRVNLKYSDKVCSALQSRHTRGYKREEKDVQKLVASMLIWKIPLGSCIPVLLMMFLGSWSDRKKRRKPFMLIPIVGEVMSSVGLLVCVYYFYELPMEVAGFVESFFPAVTGGWMTLFMALYSYMSDITSVEMRTVRIGVLSVCGKVGVPLGTALSGVALQAIGFYGIFSISAVLQIVNFAYGAIRIKECGVNRDGDVVGLKNSETRESGVKVQGEWYVLRFFTEIFDLNHVKETFAVVFKREANNRRQRIILIIFTQMMILMALHGELTLMYLFMRYRFNWDEVKFSMYSTYSFLVRVIGTSLSVGVFSHLLKCDDTVLGALSCLSKIMSGLVLAFAQQEWQVYLVPLIEIMNGTWSIALRSIASKLVPPEEMGKLNSVYGACEALTPMLYGPLFALVYAHTMDTLPGAFFILSGALTLPAFFSFCWMYQQQRRYCVEADTTTPRKSSAAEEVKKTPTPDHSVSNSGGRLNLGFEENSA